MRANHTQQLRRMFTRNRTTQEISMPDDEHDARANCDDDCTLCGADRRRHAIWSWVFLAACFGIVYAAAQGVF